MATFEVEVFDTATIYPIAIERGDNTPKIWELMHRDLDGSLVNSNLDGDVFELIFEWEDDIMELSSVNGRLGVATPRIAWTPQFSEIDRLPATGATYKLRRTQPSGERRTLLRGAVEVVGTGS